MSDIMVDSEKQKLISKIARLYYLGNLTQQEIAERLGISRTRVSRYLGLARRENIVEISINSPSGQFGELEFEIEKKFGLGECLVAPSYESRDEVRRALAGRLASKLEMILEYGSYLGIGWGTTLKSVADYIEVGKNYGVKVVPLIGGLGKIGTGVHTNSIASTLANKLGGISYMIHSPAVLDSREVKEIIENDSNNREIIELSRKVETAILGISDIGPDSTLLKSGNFRQEEFGYLKSLGVIGDINLIFIDEHGDHIKNRLDERLIRISLERVKSIRNVVVVGFGKRKVPVIQGALRGHIINTLLTDEDTAKKILGS
ncbi:MAG: sugar-binding transcriptional regulator [Actinomycetota bacterium]